MRINQRETRRLLVLLKDRLRRARQLFSKPEWCFVLIYVIFGLGFMVIVPPMQVADETSHFYRAYQVSMGRLVSENTPIGAGGYVPAGVVGFTNAANKNGVSFHPEKRFYPRSQYKELLSYQSSTANVPVRFVNTAIYAPTSYIAPAISIQAMKLFSSKILLQFYAARITNFVFFGVCLFLAIRWLPIGKWALTIIGLLPMTLNEAMSLAADGFIIASTALLVAYWLKLYTQRSVSVRQWALLALLVLSVALAKQSYFVFMPVLLLLILPVLNDRRERLRRLLIISGIGFLTLFVTLLWAWISRGFNADFVKWTISTGILINPDQHLKLILTHPWDFVGLLFNTWLTSFGDPTVWSFFGNFGWLDTPVTLWLQITLAIVIFLAFGIREPMLPESLHLKWPAVSLVWSIAFLNIVVVGVILYLYWTPLGTPFIAGYQGRYFIPVLIFLIPVLVGLYRHTIAKRTIMIMLVVVLIFSLDIVANRFYDLPGYIPHQRSLAPVTDRVKPVVKD